MKKLLLPIDFATDTTALCQYSLHLANFIQADILLLNVIPEPIPALYPGYGVHMPVADTHTILQKHIESAEAHMVELMHQMKQEMQQNGWELNVENKILIGDTSFELIKTAKDYEPDLIVVGNAHKSPAQKVFFGSVTSALIDSTDFPILSVPDAARPPACLRLAYASDFEESDGNIFRNLYDLFGGWSCQFHCIHMVSSGNYPEILTTRSFMQDVLVKHMGPLAENQVARTEIIDGDKVPEALQSYIDDQSINMLVLNTHKRSLWGKLFKPSVTQKVLYQSDTPLLIVREQT